MNDFTEEIASQLSLPVRGVSSTLQLLAEGCTIPFISRYRKERTGGMDEVQVAAVAALADKLKELAARKETVIGSICAQGRMTPGLHKAIDECRDMAALEDIYLPYKPRRRTRAQMARERGLEPLALLIMAQREPSPDKAARRFVGGDVATEADAVSGALDIIAETISEDTRARQMMRGEFRRAAVIKSVAVKTRCGTDGAARFSDYFDFSEPLRRCPAHRLLAMRRGAAEGVLRVSISADDDVCRDKLRRLFVKGHGRCSGLVAEAADDAYKRLLRPSIETEFAALSKEKADDEALGVFAGNLRQLLLSAPLGQKRVMGIDPGFRTGCKVVCLDSEGNLLHHEAVFPHPPVNRTAQAREALLRMAAGYGVEAVAIGNGTAGRETDAFVRDTFAGRNVQVFMVSEDGASVYSASAAAREEFPHEDVTVRGAVSIARRLMDPLAELVKIDPKSIGVGQYQHDVDQAKLKKSLDMTVESCVNSVGVNLNTASVHLLMYVSGLGAALARNIVEYRRENGAFTSRVQLKKVPRLGALAYEQCAGFLRIPGARNPLDNTAVHPESYAVVERMARDNGCSVAGLIADKALRGRLELGSYVTDKVGMPTLNDIMAELDKPGRDPRGQAEAFEFAAGINKPEDLVAGMVLPGIVTNITNFGAFVDIGVHQDGLVHVSQLADSFVSSPSQVVSLHQHVMVRVVDVDMRRNRISLSMKDTGK